MLNTLLSASCRILSAWRNSRKTIGAPVVGPIAAALLALWWPGNLGAVPVTVKITVDNGYGFGFGDAYGIYTGQYYGGIDNCTAGEIFNCPNGPETYNITGNLNDYIYIVAWSDDSQYEGAVASFTDGNTTVVTSENWPWEVFATGTNFNPTCITNPPPGPSFALVNTQIGLANASNGGLNSSITWVNNTNAPTDPKGRLDFEGVNGAGNYLLAPPQCIGSGAKWMWYNPKPSAISNPFQYSAVSAAIPGPNPMREFLIFRIGPLGTVLGLDTCITITNEVITCLTNGSYNYTFAVTNHFNGPVAHLVFLDLPSGMTVTPGPIITLPTVLTNGQGTTVNVTINYTGAVPTNLCFRMSAHNEDFAECCVIEHCINLSPCCLALTKQCVICTTNGNYIFDFDFQNLSGQPIKYIYLVPDGGGFSINPIVLGTPLPPGGTVHLSVPITVNTTNCVDQLCMVVSAHDVNFNECCAIRICIKLPACCPPRTYTLDADFDLGTLVNLNHNPAHHQLQLNPKTVPFPYIAVACSTRGTIVRINVNTGAILGEYLSSPDGMARNPSRTTVDKYGNVWVGNRNEQSISGGQPKGSVVRIGLIEGGIRGDKISGVFVPNPTGLYIKNPSYSTCVDRDGDGLIKTSRGLGDILSWNNAASADSNGGVSTAEDECITIYTRVTGSGTRFVSIDCDNNVWVGGLFDQDFEKLNGTTGLPVPGFQFNLGCGGYGGLVDGSGNLWSAASGMRFVPNNSFPPGTGTCLPSSFYGVGINPLNCHIYVSSGYDPNSGGSGVMELDPATGNVLNSYPAVSGGQGICVDGNGHIWVAQGNHVAHLAPLGASHFFVGNVTGFQWVTGVAVDSNGRIWGTDFSANQAVAIDPLAGPLGVGSVPIGQKMVSLTVNLGPNANPYNYSDMTGFVVLGATCRSGFWNLIHDACSSNALWGTVSWNALTPTGTSLTVEVRAADDKTTLPSKSFQAVTNNASFCAKGISGRFLEVRVTFTGAPCSTNSPVLFDLTVQCCAKNDCNPVNHLPTVECPGPVVVCPGASPTVTLNTLVSDPDGNPIQVSWREGNNPPYQVTTVPAGGPPTVGAVSFTHTYPPGVHIIILAVNDGSGFRDVCDIKVTIGDTTPPDLKCPPGVEVIGFQGSVTNFLPSVVVSDNCTQQPAIVLTQNPPPGTIVGPGSQQVTIIATDGAGNSSTCQTFYAVSPKLAIVSPANYAVFTVPANIVLLADVPTNAGPVQFVRFLRGSTVVGTATNRPYRVTTTIDTPDFYPFRAQAVNPAGIAATSDEIQLFVNPSGSPAPPLLFNPGLNGTNVRFSIPTEAGFTYYIECSDSLKPSNWQTVETTIGNGGVQTVTYPCTNSPQRYYRVRVQR